MDSHCIVLARLVSCGWVGRGFGRYGLAVYRCDAGHETRMRVNRFRGIRRTYRGALVPINLDPESSVACRHCEGSAAR